MVTFLKMSMSKFYYQHWLKNSQERAISIWLLLTNTSSVTDMVNTLQWPPLAERRLKSKLVIFYKIVHCLIAVPADHILTPTDSRTRSTHSLSYKHLQTTKDTYKWSFFPRTYYNLLEFSPIISSSVQIRRHNQRTAVPSCSPVPPLLNTKYVFKSLCT